MQCGSFLMCLVRRIAIAGIASLLLAMFALPAYAASAQSISYVRVIHASPFVGTADIFVDGTVLLSAFQFGAVTDYVPLPAGSHKVQIALVGKGINASALSKVLQVPGGGVFTIAATGATADTLGLTVFQDNNQVVSNHAKVRIYQLSPDAGTVNVAVGDDATVNNMSYPNASSYLTIPVGPCKFVVNAPQQNWSQPLPTTLAPNSVTSLFAVGLINGSPQIQLVAKQTNGVPGLPGTGSDPRPAATAAQQPIAPWLLGAITLSLIGVGFATRRPKRAK